jgi:hypothetical protein
MEKVDQEMADECRRKGCPDCGDKLYRANYKRKPRGGPDHWDKRFSFCCVREGCRRRLTLPSVRFFGRRVFIVPIVVLLSAMRHGLSPARIKQLRQMFNVDRHTLARWRKWWLETLAKSPFWKAAQASFLPLVCEATLPLYLCQRFGVWSLERLVALLKFLSPLTTRFSAGEGRDMQTQKRPGSPGRQGFAATPVSRPTDSARHDGAAAAKTHQRLRHHRTASGLYA